MQFSRTTINMLNKWLIIFVVGFLVFAPLSPTFVYAQEDPEGNDFPEEVQQDPVGYINDCLNNPVNCGYGPSDDDDEPDEPDDDPDANDNGEDDGVPGPNGTPGPGGDDGDDGSSGSDSSDYERPEVGLPDDVQNTLDNLPTNLEEAIEWHDEHFDEQEVDTDDASATGDTETTTGEPDTTAQNDVDDIDDSIVSDTASSTTDVDIESDQTLEQENTTIGDATSGGNTIESDKDVLEGTITTGDADIDSSGKVTGNTSNVSTGGGGGGGWVQRLWGAEASNNGDDVDDSVLNADAQEVKELTILNKNKAFVSNVKELLALSGGNKISGIGRVTDGGIYTGAARAKSSLLNIINTNTVDSAFLPITFDIFNTFNGNINIMDILFEAFGAALNGPGVVVANAENNVNDADDSIINANAGAWEDISVMNENEGYIYNDLDIKAISGQNQILAGRKIKQVDIRTGRVDVTNNIVNFLNTNLFKSKIGVVVINVFADWAGNLIIPGAGQLATNIPDPTGVTASTNVTANDTDDSINNALALANSDLSIISENLAGVQTDINIQANTGNNYTAFDKDADNVNIRTGQAKVMTNLLTLANRDVVGMAFSQGFFNIMGDWTGEVVGVSDSARVEGTGNSFIVADEAAALITGGPGGGAATVDSTTDDVDDSIINGTAEVGRAVTVNNKNIGLVANKLDILADSGTNDVASYKGQDINIDTGDVAVSNNIATFMNNNFAFSKGLVVALNVFGKWRGNIAYDDVKDLTVDLTSQASTDDLEPGDEVTYEVTALNSGTQPTDAGTLSMEYDPNSLDLVSADGGSVNGDTISWDFPAMESAESTTHEPVFELKEDLPEGEHEVEAAATATQQDEVESNNRIRNRMSFRIGERDTGLNHNVVAPSDSDNSDNSGSDNSGNDNNNNSGAEDDTTGNESDGNDNTTNAGSAPGNTSGGNSGGSSHTPGYLIVDKTVAGPGPYSPGDKVSYTLTISNPGDTSIDDVVIYDVLENGEIRAEVSWPIDYVERNERVTIDYEITVQSDAPSGEYYNGAYASGFDAANAVIKSHIASTVITVDNPNYVASSGVVTGAAGTLDTIEVIEGFNADATSTVSITHEDAVGTIAGGYDENAAALVLGGGELSEEAEAELEQEFEQDIRETSRINRFISGAAPVAVAAEGVYLDDEGQVLGVDTEMAGEPSQKLAYAVYPNFLHFDGMETETGTTAEKNWIVSNWLIWTLFIIALAIGYLSFREKHKQKFNGK